MMAWLRRYKNSIFVGTIAVFLIGTFVSYGGYLFTSSDMSEAVAVVGGAKIPYITFQNRSNQMLDAMRDQKQDVSDDTARQVKQEVLRDMIVDEILAQQAERLGLRVTDLELAFNIRNTPKFQSGGQFSEPAYFQYVYRVLRATPEEYERQERKRMLSGKLKQLIFNSAKLAPSETTDEALKAEYRAQNKGSEAGFSKHKDEIVETLRRSRALDLINFYLRQISSQTDIRSFLDQREQGQ